MYLIVIAVLAGLAWWYFSPRGSEERTESTLESQSENQSASPAAPASLLPTSPTDVSDNAISLDAAAIDVAFDGLNSDVTNAAQGINESQAPQ